MFDDFNSFSNFQQFSQTNINSDFTSNGDFMMLFIIAAVFIITGIIKAIRKNDKNTIGLALKKFELNEENVNPLVLIEGRAAGIISWFLTVIKISPTVSFETNSEQIIIKNQSLYGEKNRFIPLKAISQLDAKFSRNITYLILTVLFAICGIIFGITAGSEMLIKYLSLAIIFGVSYFLSKKMELVIITKSGLKHGISFKRSVIGNIAIDLEKVKTAICAINKAVLAVMKKN